MLQNGSMWVVGRMHKERWGIRMATLEPRIPFSEALIANPFVNKALASRYPSSEMPPDMACHWATHQSRPPCMRTLRQT